MSMYSSARGARLPLALNSFSILLLTLVIGLPVLAVILFAIFPRFNELSFTGPFSNFIPQFQDRHLLSAAVNSLRLALSVTLMSVLFSVILGWMRSQMTMLSNGSGMCCFWCRS